MVKTESYIVDYQINLKKDKLKLAAEIYPFLIKVLTSKYQSRKNGLSSPIRPSFVGITKFLFI